MRELIILRTHVFDAATQRLYDYLKQTSGRDVVLICEESRKPVNVGQGRPKISVTRDHFVQMGLYTPANFGWLCGDYILYAALEAFPSYDHYWMIEYDVRLGFRQSSDFFDQFLDSDADLLAFQVRKALTMWVWYAPMKPYVPEVHGCNFSLLRISRRAAEAAFKARLELSQTFRDLEAAGETPKWPNDESFTASTVVAAGYKLMGFNTAGKTYATAASFKEGVPLSDIRLANAPEDGLVHHPVHSGYRFEDKVHGWIEHYRSRKVPESRMREIFTDQVRSDLETEAGEKALATYDAAIEAWLQELKAGNL